MDTIFANYENNKTSEPHVLILKLTDKLDLRRGKKMLFSQNLSIYYTWKNIKSNKQQKIITTNLKYQLQHGIINLNYQIDHILHEIFNIILTIF